MWGRGLPAPSGNIVVLYLNLMVQFCSDSSQANDLTDFEKAFMNCILQIPCRVLHVVLHYFLLTNYAWMLCEGFYLHTLLVSAFTSEHKLVNWLMGLGWPVPAVIVTLYTSLRASSDDPADTEQ